MKQSNFSKKAQWPFLHGWNCTENFFFRYQRQSKIYYRFNSTTGGSLRYISRSSNWYGIHFTLITLKHISFLIIFVPILYYSHLQKKEQKIIKVAWIMYKYNQAEGNELKLNSYFCIWNFCFLSSIDAKIFCFRAIGNFNARGPDFCLALVV